MLLKEFIDRTGFTPTNDYYHKEEDGSLSEREGIDSIPEYIKFWRACLRRAKRYWSMDGDKLDAIQNGEALDIEIDEE